MTNGPNKSVDLSPCRCADLCRPDKRRSEQGACPELVEGRVCFGAQGAQAISSGGGAEGHVDIPCERGQVHGDADSGQRETQTSCSPDPRRIPLCRFRERGT